MPGLFGPTPGEITAFQGDRRLDRLSQFGQIPLGTLGGGMAGLLAGEAFQDLTGGSPELKRASLLQEAQQEVAASGLQPGMPGFGAAAVQALRKRGLEQEAIQAQAQALQLEQTTLQNQKLRQELQPQDDTLALQRRAEALLLSNPEMDPSLALRIAPNKKLFESVVQDNLKGKSPTAQIQNYQFSKQQGFSGTFVDYLTSLRRSGATNVNVSMGDKPATFADIGKLQMPDGSPVPTSVTDPETGKQRLPTNNELAAAGVVLKDPAAESARAKTLAQDALKEQARIPAQEALNNLKNAARAVQGAGSFSSKNTTAYNAAANRFVEAMVQFRLPGLEASDVAKEALAGSLRSRIAQATGGTMATINELEKELGAQAVDIESQLTGDPLVDKHIRKALGG